MALKSFRHFVGKFVNKSEKLVALYYLWLALKGVITRRDLALIAGDPTFIGDGFATTRHVEFLRDDRFNASFDNAFDLVPDAIRQSFLETSIAWRAHIVTWACNQALALKEGDFVECGVWYGVLSKAMLQYKDFGSQDRQFYLVDPWGGLSNYDDDIFDVVGKRFGEYKNVHLVRGLVPDVLPQIPSQKIAYLSIDMNGSKPERAALEYFYGNMVPGGVIYFDDYGWNYPDLRATVNEFFSDKPEELLHFPSGNSIVIKV